MTELSLSEKMYELVSNHTTEITEVETKFFHDQFIERVDTQKYIYNNNVVLIIKNRMMKFFKNTSFHPSLSINLELFIGNHLVWKSIEVSYYKDCIGDFLPDIMPICQDIITRKINELYQAEIDKENIKKLNRLNEIQSLCSKLNKEMSENYFTKLGNQLIKEEQKP